MFSLKNYYKPIQSAYKKAIVAINCISLALLGASYFTDKPEIAFGVLVVNVVSKELIKLSAASNETETETTDKPL